MTNSVNWADVIEEAKSGGGGSFELIPDGDYDLRATDVTASTTQNGKAMYTIEATIEGGPHNSRKVWDRLIVSPENGRAMGFFFRKMAALGAPVQFFQNSPTDDQIVNQIKGNAFRGKIGKGKEFNNKIPNEIKEYYPAATGLTGPPAQGGFPPAPQQFQQPQQSAPAPQYQQAPPAPVQQAPAPQYAPQAPPAAPQYNQQVPPAPQFGQQAPQAQGAPLPPPPAPQSPWDNSGGQPAPTLPF